MSTPDIRHCSRCGQQNPAEPLDPIHKCEHGIPCTVKILADCPACDMKARQQAAKREERRALWSGRVVASLQHKPLAALGGAPASGVASGPVGIVRKR